ncbi:MAG: hypothetical protein QW085_04715 [Pyrobaculum sp.]
MRTELVFIPILLGMAIAALSFLKPVEYSKADLSSIYLYWPEAYKYAEAGDPAPVYRFSGLVTCGDLNAPPGISYRVLNLTCRFRP